MYTHVKDMYITTLLYAVRSSMWSWIMGLFFVFNFLLLIFFVCVLNNVQMSTSYLAFFSFFFENVLFLEIRTLACLFFLQSYCISVHVAVIRFLFKCSFCLFWFSLNVVLKIMKPGLKRNMKRRHWEKDESCCQL